MALVISPLVSGDLHLYTNSMSHAADMLTEPHLDLRDWKCLADEDPGRLARMFLDRLQNLLPEDQRRAAIASLASVDRLTALFSSGRSGDKPLSEAPYFLKDLFPLSGEPTRAGSGFIGGIQTVPTKDAAIACRLAAAGAVCAGKSQLHEFALGLTGQNPHFGDCHHPFFPGRTSGGSSSGSAALVAAGVVPFSVGTDTGGSVRVPASFCGIYGFRDHPSDSLIADAFPLSRSCDAAGWFAANLPDLITVTRTLLGPARPSPGKREPRGVHLALGRLDQEVKDRFVQTADIYCPPAEGATKNLLENAFSDLATTYSVLTSTEAYAVHASWLDVHRQEYSEAVWKRLDQGRRWSQDQQGRALINRRFLRDTMTSFFLSYDFLILPATPCAALLNGECDIFDRSRILELNAPASLCGLPALSMPFPLGGGLSAGLQVIVPDAGSPVLEWLQNFP
jgi:amidase/aspartyl-tRNA(Asn)/glutamyl-tRNA(Gln) amidotransferase subunit A